MAMGETMRRCITCLYPDTKPNLIFNEEGECSACVSAKKKREIDWGARKSELEQLLDRHHGEVLVPSSGGKDSFYQALTLKEMGAHVTAITARTCHLTEIGRKNLDNMAKHVKTIEYVPNMTVRAKLNRLGLELVGDISHPEHMAIFTVPFHAANDFKTPLVMYGECPELEYGGPHGADEAMQLTERWRSEYGGFLGLRPSDFVGMEGITKKDMEYYELPRSNMPVEAHFLGQYIPWDSHRNAEIAKDHGMTTELPAENVWWGFENLDNAQTGIHDYFAYLKYGYGRITAQLSVDIRRGLITREAAETIRAEREPLFPFFYSGIHIHYILENINISWDRFVETCKQFTNTDTHPDFNKIRPTTSR